MCVKRQTKCCDVGLIRRKIEELDYSRTNLYGNKFNKAGPNRSFSEKELILGIKAASHLRKNTFGFKIEKKDIQI